MVKLQEIWFRCTWFPESRRWKPNGSETMTINKNVQMQVNGGTKKLKRGDRVQTRIQDMFGNFFSRDNRTLVLSYRGERKSVFGSGWTHWRIPGKTEISASYIHRTDIASSEIILQNRDSRNLCLGYYRSPGNRQVNNITVLVPNRNNCLPRGFEWLFSFDYNFWRTNTS